MIDHRLALSVTNPDGSVKRWGFDEKDGGDVPADLNFSTRVPGGFGTLGCSLLRGLEPRADEGLFRDVRAYGVGNQTAFEGRMGAMPRSNDTLRPSAVGYAAHLMDDPSFREIYLDRDLSQWSGPTAARRIALANLIIRTASDPTVLATGSGAPAVSTAIVRPWGGPIASEARYDSGGIPLGSLFYAWSRKDGNVNASATDWSWTACIASDIDLAGTYDTAGNLRAVGPATGTLIATGARVSALVQMMHAASAAGNEQLEYAIYWTCLAVYGTHGLPEQGAGSATTAPGIFGHDIMADIVGRTAPMLRFTTGPDGTIQPVTYALEHCVFRDLITGGDAIAFVNAYYLNEWAVWENRTFWWKPPDRESRVWEARVSEGAVLDLEGDDSEDVVNGVVVTFTDYMGEKRVVGPPGTIGADLISTALQDTDPNNPVDLSQIPRKWAVIDLTVVTTLLGAEQIGRVYLAETLLATRRGSITLTGPVKLRGQAGLHPAWAVRAGDGVIVTDRPGEPVRRIIETNYTHGPQTVTGTLDSTAAKLPAILERLNVGAVGRYV